MPKFLQLNHKIDHRKLFAPERLQLVSGRSYKLLNIDYDKDRVFATAQIKSVTTLKDNERLYIRGIANANIVDRAEERVDPRGGIFENYLKNPQLLAHHSYVHAIGQVETLEVLDEGVMFEAWIGDPTKGVLTPMQLECRSLTAQGILKTVSIGFIPKKIRQPLFNDNGEITEPLVIEQWELLELSVVAVPCNQDSVYEIRTTAADKKSATIIAKRSIENLLKELAEQNMVVQSLIFNKDKFTKDEAINWAKDNDYATDKCEDTADSYRLLQRDPEDFDDESLKTITLIDGVQAVSGKVKTEAAAPPAAETPPADGGGDVASALADIKTSLAQVSDVLQQVLKAVQNESETPPKEPVTPPAEPAKAVDARVEKLEKGFDKLVQSVNLLVTKLNK